MALGVRMMRRSPLIAAAFLGATLVQGAIQGLLIWALRHVLESFGKQGDLTVRLVLANGLAIFSVWLLRSLSVFTAETMSVQLSHRVEIRSMLEVLGKLLRLSVRFFDRSHQADLIMAAYHDLKGVRNVTLEVGRMVLYLSQLVGLAIAAWMISPTLAIAGLVAVPLGVLPAYWFGRAITGAAYGEREAVSTLHQSFLQVTSSIRVIKVNRSEDRVLESARRIGRELHRHLVRQAVQKGLARLLLETVSGLGLIVVLTLGGYQVAQGTLAWEALLGLMVAMMAVYSPVVGLVQVYGVIRSILPNLDRIEQIRREVVEIEDRPGARPLLAAPRVIELDSLSFSHDGRPVLEGVTARFEAGERIGIVGPSGAGKSTLISLLLRFYDPTAGAIRLDGVDLRDLRHADWMDRTAIVLQEPVVFLDTVANNIRLGQPDAGMESVIAAGRAANIHDEIMAMQHGYDTIVGVGSGARGISVGQKQRICIAAAVLKDAPVLFLDEATSSLDAVSERKVQAAIDHLMEGRTTFVVAHRFSTLRNVDRILVLDQGRLVGLGSHDELVSTCRPYRSLWESQGSPALTPVRARPSRREAYGG
jgi:ABC-type multidrug transport system fused ATPase/permease subunit